MMYLQIISSFAISWPLRKLLDVMMRFQYLMTGDVIFRWPEQGVVMEATELSDGILVCHNDDTPLMELEKLGDLLLIF